MEPPRGEGRGDRQINRFYDCLWRPIMTNRTTIGTFLYSMYGIEYRPSMFKNFTNENHNIENIRLCEKCVQR